MNGQLAGRKYCPHEISRSGVCEGHCRTDERELDETAEPFAAMSEDAISSVREMDGIAFDLMMDGSIRAHGRTGVYQVTAVKLALTCTKQEEVF